MVINKIVTVVSLFLLSVTAYSVHADTINGSFIVDGAFSTNVDLESAPGATLSEVTEITLLTVYGTTGGSTGDTNNVVFSSENKTAGTTVLLAGVISVPGFLNIEDWSLELTSLTIEDQYDGLLTLSGMGVLTGSRDGNVYDPTSAIWTFSTTDLGDWDGTNLRDGTYSMSVQTTVVPVPAAVWLFGTGLIGLIGVARRKV